MPNYFADYDTTVHFISEEEFARDHSSHPSRRLCHSEAAEPDGRRRTRHVIEYSLKLDSNPEFTSSVLVAYARAVARLHAEGQTGCRSVFDIAPAYLSAKTGEELRATLL